MNYQYLHYDFFTTCRKRKINKVPMLLLIYLRGLYSRFGNIFTWKDMTVMTDLGINGTGSDHHYQVARKRF